MHPSENVIVDMLDGEIQIAADIFLLSHEIKKLFAGFVRIAVQHTQPVDTGNVGTLPHQ